MNRTITIGLLLALLLVSGCEVNKTGSPEIRADYTNAPTEVKESNASREESYMHVKTSDPIKMTSFIIRPLMGSVISYCRWNEVMMKICRCRASLRSCPIMGILIQREPRTQSTR
jgi:hypothetical protein